MFNKYKTIRAILSSARPYTGLAIPDIFHTIAFLLSNGDLYRIKTQTTRDADFRWGDHRHIVVRSRRVGSGHRPSQISLAKFSRHEAQHCVGIRDIRYWFVLCGKVWFDSGY